MLVSPYAILLDGESGSVLASKKGDEKIFPASMVKVMTVLTAIRSISDLDATTTMSAGFYDELYAQDASRAGFEPGEEAKICDLLYGALLPSGAECCMQLAIEAAGSEDAFVELMNQNALDMGLVQTHFTNATGLHNEEQYSTPHEIGEILRTALKNKTFYQVFTTHSYTQRDCGGVGRIYILELTFLKHYGRQCERRKDHMGMDDSKRRCRAAS